ARWGDVPSRSQVEEQASRREHDAWLPGQAARAPRLDTRTIHQLRRLLWREFRRLYRAAPNHDGWGRYLLRPQSPARFGGCDRRKDQSSQREAATVREGDGSISALGPGYLPKMFT